MRYVSYARICVYLDIYKELPESIKLSSLDEQWLQAIDYEHISFRCCKSHEYGHLFREGPLNFLSLMPQSKNREKDAKGFEKVSNRKRTTKRNPSLEGHKKPQTSNRYEALSKATNEEEGRVSTGEQMTQSIGKETAEDAPRHSETTEQIETEGV